MKKKIITGALIQALLMGTPAMATVSRSISRFRGKKVYSCTQEEHYHAGELERETVVDPFAAFGKSEITSTDTSNETGDVLEFLREEGLLCKNCEQSSQTSGNLNNDLESRKIFAAGCCYYTSWTSYCVASVTNQTDCTASPYSTSRAWRLSAPSIYSTSVSSVTAAGFDLSVRASATSDAYAVMTLRSATAPNATQVKNGQDGDGNPALATQTSASATNHTLSFSGLSDADQNKYNVYSIVEDGDGASAVSSNAVLKTENLTPLSVESISGWGNPDIEMDSSGNIYVSCEKGYDNSDTQSVDKWNGSSWQDYASLSKGGFNNQSRSDMVIDSNGDLHIFINAATGSQFTDGDLYHSKYNGSWSSHTKVYDGVEGIEAQGDSINYGFVDSSDKLHAGFVINSKAYYATNKSGSWATKLIDNVNSGDGIRIWAMTDTSGDAYVFYMDDSDTNLKVAVSNDNFASDKNISTVINGSGGGFKINPSNVIIDSSDEFHIVYMNTTNNQAYYVTGTPGSWTTEQIPAEGFSSVKPLYVQVNGGVVYVLMYNGTEHLHYFVKKELGSWTEGKFFDAGTNSEASTFLINSTNDKFFLSYQAGSNENVKTYVENISDLIAGSSNDYDGDLTAGITIDESSPIDIPTTADSAGEAVGILDFKIIDGGGGDGVPLDITDLDINTDNADDTVNNKLAFLLNGPDAANVIGDFNDSTSKITFNGLSISITDGSNETYTLKAYWNNNTGLTEGYSLTYSIDGDTDVTVDGSGTQMGATSAINNSDNAVIDVTATKLFFSQQPAGSKSGFALTTQPKVSAGDDYNNVDADYTGLVTLTEASAGDLSGDVDITAVGGVATFSDVTYTATADQENFSLTASDGGLTNATSNVVTSDVAATKLVFTTQPGPTDLENGVVMDFTTDPVVEARDNDDLLDRDFTETVTLSENDPVGTGTFTNNSFAAVEGVATFTGLTLNHDNDATFQLVANDEDGVGTNLPTVNSTDLTVTSNNVPTITVNNKSYTENNPASAIDSSATANDVDGDDEWDTNAKLEVQITANNETTDELSIDTSGSFSIASGELSYSGTKVADISENSGVANDGTVTSGDLLTLNFNANATNAIVQNLVRSIKYRSTSDDPTATSSTRTVTFSLTDKNGGSANDTSTITAANDAPTDININLNPAVRRQLY